MIDNSPMNHPTFDILQRAPDKFGDRLALKNIAIGTGISLHGILAFRVGPNIHTRQGRWWLLASLAMVVGGGVFVFIMQHDFGYKAIGKK